MKLRGHTKILLYVSVAWLLFWLLGLPGYYQQYTTLFMLVFDLVILIPLTGILFWILSRTPRKYRMSLSLWLAFYITVPLFIYDYLYCGIYLGDGLSFLNKYWYLSVYYIIPWILCLIIVFFLNRKPGEIARG